MPVLLSDEEIKGYMVESEDADGRALIAWARHIRKAQLKQVVKWGEEMCKDHNRTQRKELRWDVKHRECSICWQALKKEAE